VGFDALKRARRISDLFEVHGTGNHGDAQLVIIINQNLQLGSLYDS